MLLGQACICPSAHGKPPPLRRAAFGVFKCQGAEGTLGAGLGRCSQGHQDQKSVGVASGQQVISDSVRSRE